VRTTSKFWVPLKTLNEIKAFGLNHGSIGLRNVGLKMGQITFKSEQKVEQLTGGDLDVFGFVF
jgi:hypothetical protein